ncbi:3416_t:CDS:2, partial [Gigaspora margarita]
SERKKEGLEDQRVWKSTYWINHKPYGPILPPYKPESVNKTQELFNSISVTTDITILKKA